LVEIEGPLGTGLGIQTKGRHVAFAAGTGILAFIDLVAHLILRLLNFPAEYAEPLIDLNNFSFILYTCFSCHEDVIGLQLIDCLLELCRIHKKPDLF